MIRRVLLVVMGVSLFATSSAAAYCRTTTCAQKTPPAECTPGVFDGSCQLAGKPLFWKENCASFSVNVSGSKKLGITADQLQQIGRQAFDTWQGADCPSGGKPNIYIETYPQVECAEARYNKQGPNQNVWVFRDDAWLDLSYVIALTSVSFDPNSGEIYDTDMEFNSFDFAFNLESDGSGIDLQAVVQHESGHVLGLAHSDIPTATMYTRYGGRVDMRTLEPDDAEGVCAAYPPVATPDVACNTEPRHGFSTQCSEPDDEGCSCTVPGKGATRRGVVLLFAALGLLLVRPRRTSTLLSS